ncbi:hypothetical protein [Epibacterium ulvae]|uniref:hypothetical protein n=1 Tax=Epibacterium ulvae TaxID=1156985 RepID=UPI00248F6F88|nr:hypothetical protein [Epibacterium ulvae]
MEVVKDIFDAFSERVRSPFLGSILLAFAFWNWQVLWFVLFADVPVADRIAYFDAHTDRWQSYLYPILSGVAFAVFMPWLRYVGAEIAKRPNARLKQLQSEEARQRRIAHIRASIAEEKAKSDLKVAQFEMALAEEEAKSAAEAAAAEAKAHREQELIEAKKRLDEAREVGAEEELQETRETLTARREAAVSAAAIDEEVAGMAANPYFLNFLHLAVSSPIGRISIRDNVVFRVAQDGKHEIAWRPETHRERLLFKEALAELKHSKLFERLDHNQFEISQAGYDMLDQISGSAEGLENA